MTERNWLVALRKKAGLNQKEAAFRSGIKQPSYCEIEKGKSTPRIYTAKRIAEVLGFDWTLFFEEADKE